MKIICIREFDKVLPLGLVARIKYKLNMFVFGAPKLGKSYTMIDIHQLGDHLYYVLKEFDPEYLFDSNHFAFPTLGELIKIDKEYEQEASSNL